MQVYVGLDLGVDTEDTNDSLTLVTYDKEPSRSKALLDFRPDNNKHSSEDSQIIKP
jgi:hypothetical protein